MPHINVTPAPESSPIVAGIQYQSKEFSRGYRPEGTKDWLMVSTLDGVGYVKAEGTTRTLRRGDILLIAPDTPQEYGHLDDDSRWVNIWVHVRPRPHWLPWLAWPRISRGIMILEAGEQFEPIESELRRMVEVSNAPLRLRYEAAMNSLERVLITADDLNPLHGASQLDGRIKKALEIVGERLAAPLNIATLGKAVGLSRSRFSVLFTEQVNLSPQAYIEFVRLARAAQMLHSSSWSVAHIAEEVGFPNAYYFSTRFRRRYGVPPSAYRSAQEGRMNDRAVQ
jgi:AraC family transcriptional regulator of arabinose operon